MMDHGLNIHLTISQLINLLHQLLGTVNPLHSPPLLNGQPQTCTTLNGLPGMKPLQFLSTPMTFQLLHTQQSLSPLQLVAISTTVRQPHHTSHTYPAPLLGLTTMLLLQFLSFSLMSLHKLMSLFMNHHHILVINSKMKTQDHTFLMYLLLTFGLQHMKLQLLIYITLKSQLVPAYTNQAHHQQSHITTGTNPPAPTCHTPHPQLFGLTTTNPQRPISSPLMNPSRPTSLSQTHHHTSHTSHGVKNHKHSSHMCLPLLSGLNITKLQLLISTTTMHQLQPTTWRPCHHPSLNTTIMNQQCHHSCITHPP